MNASFERKINAIEKVDRQRAEDIQVLRDAHARMMEAVKMSQTLLESGH